MEAQASAFKCSGCSRRFKTEQAKNDHERDKHRESSGGTFFESQEDTWFANGCHGAIEDYTGEEY